MSIGMIDKIARLHGVETRVIGNTVAVLETGTINGEPSSRWLDASSWTGAQLYEWLGY